MNTTGHCSSVNMQDICEKEMENMMYVKNTYIPIRKRRRRKRFPVKIITDDIGSSFDLFAALSADNIKKYKANMKYNCRKNPATHNKLRNAVSFDVTPVDLKTVRQNRKNIETLKAERKRGGDALKKKYKLHQPEIKTFNDVTFSPNTTFDKLLRSSRKPLVDKNSVLNVNHQVRGIKSEGSMTWDSEQNAENSHCSISSTRRSLCRRLSHVVIPDTWPRERSGSGFSLSVSDKTAISPSVSVIVEEDELVPKFTTTTQRVDCAKDMVLHKCNQSEPLEFEDVFPPRYFDNCKKIGEGLYGEVFKCQYNCSPVRVLKIIPIEGHMLVNGEKQKKYHEVLSELDITMELSNLRHDTQFETNCFVEVTNCRCMQGKYPQRLVDLWFDYHKEKVSENDPPTIFDDSQLFIVLELADGGEALESYCFTSAAQAFSAFIQLTFALAVAEITLEFEHRDLHWGNVLINRTTSKHIIFKLNGKKFSVPSNGIQVTVIDFTLSRMSYGGYCIFNDLAVDPDLFISQGDYQFDIYRLMQNALKNEWHHFKPYTNILWLHYTLDKMLSSVHYKNTSTKIHKKFKKRLTQCYNDALKYNSAYELVTSGNILEMMK